ncbi:MAG: nickel ABC transporter permease subunit NikC, partial [Desulfitobacterium sp.]|nr:nickel ABC transporter permease subunit NikC [Desulfitobacterium sp.]
MDITQRMLKIQSRDPVYLRFGIFLALVILICTLSLLAPFLAPNDPYLVNLEIALESPSGEYPFGTDQLGRCVFSRVIHGASASIFSSLLLVGIVFSVGTIIGVLAGYFGGLFDTICMRIVDILLAFPGMVLAIAVAGTLGSGLKNA